MKTKQLKRKPKTEHLIVGSQVSPALYKANIPKRFVRPECTLSTFKWGTRLQAWIDLLEAEPSKAYLVACKPEDALPVCAMLTRTLIIRGRDAVFTTLAELMDGEMPRACEYLVVAGFYDDAFHRSKGSPLTPKEAFRLSWLLWRLSCDGTTLVTQCSPSASGMGNWWSVGALTSLFNPSETFTL